MHDPQSHHADLLRRAQALLSRYLQRYWYRAVQAGGSLGDLFVTVEEVSAELGVGQMTPPIKLDPPERLAARIRALRQAEQMQRESEQPAARLMEQAGLDEEALELLLILGSLQRSPGLLRACTFAWADFSQKQPTVGFLVELLADDEQHRDRLERALAPDQPLRRLQLIRLGEDRRWQPASPLLQRPIFLPQSVDRFLQERPVVGESYRPGVARLEREGLLPEDLILHEPLRLAHLLSRLCSGADPLPTLLIGEKGSGRRSLARAYALQAERPLLKVDLEALPWELAPFEEQLAAILCLLGCRLTGLVSGILYALNISHWARITFRPLSNG